MRRGQFMWVLMGVVESFIGALTFSGASQHADESKETGVSSTDPLGHAHEDLIDMLGSCLFGWGCLGVEGKLHSLPLVHRPEWP
jgi:hypothetical protein